MSTEARIRRALYLHGLFDLDTAPFAASARIVYHYCDWEAATGILKERQFWATEYDCMKDTTEIRAADAVILDVAQQLRTTATGLAADVLADFITDYPNKHVTKVVPVFLSCFSVARDDPNQWIEYAAGGKGVCLGIPSLSEPQPDNEPLNLMRVAVNYSETEWRAKVTDQFSKALAAMNREAPLKRHSVWALFVIALLVAVSAKRADLFAEQEVRVLGIGRRGGPQPDVRERQKDGRTIRYVRLNVRQRDKRIALTEIIVGPNQDANEGCHRAQQILENAGYTPDAAEYPRIVPCAAR